MRRLFRAVLLLLAVYAVFVVAARLLFPLPDISDRPSEQAIPASTGTALGRALVAAETEHPGLSGIVALPSGQDALASRMTLIEQAESSIDSQYYIWHDDTSGILLLDALARAAARGVRVRLLLDDNGVPGMDAYMAHLDSQPNFDIRLFNPSTVRSPKMLGYTFDFFRMNRRMHNKSLIVDGGAAIIGGRNIGNEYFEIGESYYKDMDALAIGPIATETAAVFDQYWNSRSVFSVADIISGKPGDTSFATRVAEVTISDEAKTVQSDLASSAARYANGAQSLEWTTVQLIADDPAKGEGNASRDQLMISRLGAILGTVETRLDLVSAYFVPGEPGVAYFGGLAKDGKDVRILTNALNTTDVLLVHSGYTKYRRELLEDGVKLYELKLRGDMAPETQTQLKPLGLSGASLHAKTFAVDGKRVFIGSFNFDPRSATLNCEMGFLIDSIPMARKVSAGFDGPLDMVSYRPELTPEDNMVWQERTDANTVVTYQKEPGATWFQQVALTVIGLLPIEWLL